MSAGAASVTQLRTIVSNTVADPPASSNMVPDATGQIRAVDFLPYIANITRALLVPSYVVELSVDTDLILLAFDTFTIGTMTANGFIQAESIV
jgi:hypothetical protein